MLTRSIEIELFDLSIGQKISRNAKRVCIVLAVVAVTICTLDLMNIRSFANAVDFVHGSRQRIVQLPHLLRNMIQSAVRASPVPSAVAMIPRGEFATVLRLTRSAAADALSVSDASPVAALAATRALDAVALAMAPPAAANTEPQVTSAISEPPAASTKSETPLAVAPKSPFASAQPEAPVAAPEAAPVAKAPAPAVVETPPPPAQPTMQVSTEPTPQAPPAVQARTEPAPTPPAQPAQPAVLASADPAQLPTPPATPVSLPMSTAIPLDMVPLPRPAPGAPPPSPAELLHLEGKSYAKAERCLANAIYFEARGEPVSGQIAVAQVVMNRVFSGFYPTDVCAVIYQNANRHLACQFTFACDGKRKIINERGALGARQPHRQADTRRQAL